MDIKWKKEWLQTKNLFIIMSVFLFFSHTISLCTCSAYGKRASSRTYGEKRYQQQQSELQQEKQKLQQLQQQQIKKLQQQESTAENVKSLFNKIPEEVLAHVGTFMENDDVKPFGQTNKNVYNGLINKIVHGKTQNYNYGDIPHFYKLHEFANDEKMNKIYRDILDYTNINQIKFVINNFINNGLHNKFKNANMLSNNYIKNFQNILILIHFSKSGLIEKYKNKGTFSSKYIKSINDIQLAIDLYYGYLFLDVLDNYNEVIPFDEPNFDSNTFDLTELIFPNIHKAFQRTNTNQYNNFYNYLNVSHLATDYKTYENYRYLGEGIEYKYIDSDINDNTIINKQNEQFIALTHIDFRNGNLIGTEPVLQWPPYLKYLDLSGNRLRSLVSIQSMPDTIETIILNRIEDNTSGKMNDFQMPDLFSLKFNLDINFPRMRTTFPPNLKYLSIPCHNDVMSGTGAEYEEYISRLYCSGRKVESRKSKFNVSVLSPNLETLILTNNPFYGQIDVNLLPKTLKYFDIRNHSGITFINKDKRPHLKILD